MMTMEDFLSTVRDELGLPVTAEDVGPGLDELPNWDSMYPLWLLTGTFAVSSLGHRLVDSFHSVAGTTVALGLGKTVLRPVEFPAAEDVTALVADSGVPSHPRHERAPRSALSRIDGFSRWSAAFWPWSALWASAFIAHSRSAAYDD